MYYYTYRIICYHPESKEKYYYGYRSSILPPEKDINYWSSSKYVKIAMKKFGKEFFIKKVIKIFNNKNDALEHEIKLHERLNVADNSLFFNRYSQSRCGKIHYGDYLRGKTYEEIHGYDKALSLKKIRRNQALCKDNSGTNNPMYGKKHSIQSIEKMKINSAKPNNTIWITNGTENKKIKNNDTIPYGWYKGRSNVKITSPLGYKWITNGEKTTRIKNNDTIPYGWYKGRSSLS